MLTLIIPIVLFVDRDTAVVYYAKLLYCKSVDYFPLILYSYECFAWFMLQLYLQPYWCNFTLFENCSVLLWEHFPFFIGVLKRNIVIYILGKIISKFSLFQFNIYIYIYLIEGITYYQQFELNNADSNGGTNNEEKRVHIENRKIKEQELLS